MNGYHPDPSRSQIVEVWADNLEEEFQHIRDVVERYHYIAIDTEFPGIVARPNGSCLEYNYKTVKYNVDLLKVIQLGITFADSQGNLAMDTCTWQFNFSFDLSIDMYAQDSIDFLKHSGIDFDKQEKKGITLRDFGELIISSGLVMNEDVKWISFHGSYDFGYLLKLLTCAPLPELEAQFFELLHDFFPALYDIKFLLMNIRKLNVNSGQSLQKIADHLSVTRIGMQHQAGSDSLVTCRTFFKLMETYFDNQIDDSKFSGIIYGLGTPSRSNRTMHIDHGNGIVINNNTHSQNNKSPSISSQPYISSSLPLTQDENAYYISSMELNPYSNNPILMPPQTSPSSLGTLSSNGYSSSSQFNSSPISLQQHPTSTAINNDSDLMNSHFETSDINNKNLNTIPHSNTSSHPLSSHNLTYHNSSLHHSNSLQHPATYPSTSFLFSATSSSSNPQVLSNTNGGTNLGLAINQQNFYLNQFLVSNNQTGNRDTAALQLNIPQTYMTPSQSSFSISNSSVRLSNAHNLIYTASEYSEQASLHSTQNLGYANNGAASHVFMDRMLVHQGPSNGN